LFPFVSCSLPVFAWKKYRVNFPLRSGFVFGCPFRPHLGFRGVGRTADADSTESCHIGLTFRKKPGIKSTHGF
jgi:hypothetical protein